MVPNLVIGTKNSVVCLQFKVDSLHVWAQMPCIAGSRRSAAQKAACRATLAAINSCKQDKENLNPSNLNDLGTVCHYLYSTTVKKLETKTNRAGAFQRKLHNVSWKLGRSIAKNMSLGDQLSQSERYLANTVILLRLLRVKQT